MDDFIRELPKAELHLHLEGTLEPEMMMEMAARNKVAVPYRDVEEVKRAHVFGDLQSFLDLYYASCAVLRTERDFYELTLAYITKAASQGVRHAEVFFDPQTHTSRLVPFEAVVSGIHFGLIEGESRFGVTSQLILSFLRHLSEEEAHETLEEGLRYREWLSGVGLDSSELGNPPAKFAEVFAIARSEGLHSVVHAGEEGPPEYIWEALNLLGAERIDHGVRCLEDDLLVARLVADNVPLTVCPLSNVRLAVFPSLAEHPLKSMLQCGLRVSVNSDDPAYFGGYIADNYAAATEALALTREQLVGIARNSFLSSFLGESERNFHLEELEKIAAS